MSITHPYRISFKGDNPWDMQVYTTDAEGKETPLRIKEATITIKPNEAYAHVTIFRPSLDLADIPASIEVVTPEQIVQQQKQLQADGRKAFEAWLKSLDSNDDRFHRFAMRTLATISPRIFVLYRKHDQTGVSGTGFIAVGIDYSENMLQHRPRPVHLYWMGHHATKGEYQDIYQLLAIHAHDDQTEIVWLDKEEEQEQKHVTDESTKS